jgi:hypothetical protein
MYIDVTKKRGSYTREIIKELPKIRELFYDKSVSVDEMREFVRSVITRTKKTVARERFLGYLDDAESKWTIDAICFNAIQKGRRYQS